MSASGKEASSSSASAKEGSRFSAQVGMSTGGAAAISQQQQQQPHHNSNNTKPDHDVSNNPPLGPVADHLPNSALNLAQAILVYDSSWRPGVASVSKGSNHHASASSANHPPSTNAPATITPPAPRLKSRGYVSDGSSSSDHTSSNRASSRADATNAKETETTKPRISSAATSRSRPSTAVSSSLPVMPKSTGSIGPSGGQVDALHEKQTVQSSNNNNGAILYGNDWGWGLPSGSNAAPVLDLPAGGGASAVAMHRARRAQAEDAAAQSSSHSQQRMVEPHHPVVIQRPSSGAIRGFSAPVVRPGSALFAYSQPMPKPQVVTNDVVKKAHPNNSGGVTRIKEYNRLADSLNQALSSYAEAAVHAASLSTKEVKKASKKSKKLSNSKEESDAELSLFKNAQQSAQTNASTKLQAQLTELPQQISAPMDQSSMVSDYGSITNSQLPSSSSSSFGVGANGPNSQYVYSVNADGIQTVIPLSLFVHQQQQNEALQRLLEQQHALQQQQLHQQMQQQMQQQYAIQQQQIQQQQLLELQHRKQMTGVETSLASQAAQMREKLNILDSSSMASNQTATSPAHPSPETEPLQKDGPKDEIDAEAAEIAAAEAQRRAETAESEKLAREAALKLEELQRSQRRFSTTTAKPKIELRPQPTKAIPPSPLPVDKKDERRSNELSRAALIARASSAVIQLGRTKAGSPVTSLMDHPAWPTLVSAANATGASMQWVESTIKSWQLSVMSEALNDSDVSPLLIGMSPELKHAYPTRLLLSLVKDLCDEVSSSPPVDAPSHIQKLYASSGPPLSSPYPNQPVKVSFSADLPSAWLWFLQLARDLRSCWAAGTDYAQSKRSERIKKPTGVSDTEEEDDEEEGDKSKEKTSASVTMSVSSRRRDKSIYHSVRSDAYICASASAAALAKTISQRETALATELLSSSGFGSKNDESSHSSFSPPIAEPLTEEEIMAVTEAAAESAEAVLEPFGEVVQEDHILRLLRRVPMPTVTASTLFARTALAFAGWGSLNDAAATVMRTFLEEMRPLAKGLDKEAAAESIKKSADAVERDMAIVEAALLEPIILCSQNLLATFTEAGVRVGPGGFITPSSARAMVVQQQPSLAATLTSTSGPPSVTQHQHQQQSGSPLHSSALQRMLTSGGGTATNVKRSAAVASSDAGFSPNRIRSGYETPSNPASPNPHYGSASLLTSVAPSRRGSLTGNIASSKSRPSSAASGRAASEVGSSSSSSSVSAALTAAPIVDGVRVLSIFDAHSWSTLIYVRTRTCASSALDSLFSTPTEALSLHYAFVRQCLAPPLTDDDIREAAELALTRTVMGRSPMGAFKSFDPIADKEDSEEISHLINSSKALLKRNRSPMRHYYPTRYLLSLVRTLVAHVSSSSTHAHVSSPISDAHASSSSAHGAHGAHAHHDRYLFITGSTTANAVIESSEPISVWQVRTAWIFFLQLRRAMDLTWASAFSWHSKSSQGEESASPKTKSEKYVPFGELVQMDLILRLLERLSLSSIASKVLFVRTALAFCGWGSLEDASATIIRSHLEEAASDANHDREVLEGRIKERALVKEQRANEREQKRLQIVERKRQREVAKAERVKLERQLAHQFAEEKAAQQAIEEMEASERAAVEQMELEAAFAAKAQIEADEKAAAEREAAVVAKAIAEKELAEAAAIAMKEAAEREAAAISLKEAAAVAVAAVEKEAAEREAAAVEAAVVAAAVEREAVEREAAAVEAAATAEATLSAQTQLMKADKEVAGREVHASTGVIDTSSLPPLSVVVASIESKIAEQQLQQRSSDEKPSDHNRLVSPSETLISIGAEIQSAEVERQELVDVKNESLAIAAHVTEQISVVAAPVVTEPEAVAAPVVTEPEVVAAPVATEPEVVAAPVATEPEAVAAPVATEPEAVAASVATEPEVVAAPVATEPEAVAAPVATEPEAVAAPVATEPEVVAAPVATEPEAVAAPVVTEPEAVAAPVVTEPEAVAAPVATEPEAVAAPVVTEPEAVAAPVATEPEAVAAPVATEPEVVAAPVATEPEVVAAPVATEPEAVAAPVATEPEAVAAPVATEPEVVAAPSVTEPEVAIAAETLTRTLNDLLIELLSDPLKDGSACAVVNKIVDERKERGDPLESDGASDLLVQFGVSALSIHGSIGNKFNQAVAESLKALFFADGFTEEGLLAWFLSLEESPNNGVLELAAAPIVNEMEELKSKSSHKIRAGMFDESSGRNGSYNHINNQHHALNIAETVLSAGHVAHSHADMDDDYDTEEEEAEDNNEEAEANADVEHIHLPPVIDLDACMKIAEATLTAGVRLLPWDQSRPFGGGGIRVKPGVLVGISDAAKSVKNQHGLPDALYVNTSVSSSSSSSIGDIISNKTKVSKKKSENSIYAGISGDAESDIVESTMDADGKSIDELTHGDLFGPSAWSHLSYAKDRTSQVDNFEVISSTPIDVLSLHYTFLKQCIKSPERFDKGAFEAAEAQAELDALKSPTKTNIDLSLLLMDKSGIGGPGASPLLTHGIRTEVTSLLGHSSMRSAAASIVPNIKSLPSAILPQSVVAMMEKTAISATDPANHPSPASSATSSGELGLALDRAIAASDSSLPSDFDKKKIKVLFLAAKDDGRTPIADPRTGQPLLVRAAANVEDAEAIFASLSRQARRNN